MQTVPKPEAADRTMARGTALGSLFPVPLDFQFAGPAPCDPLGAKEEPKDTYAMTALYVAEVGAEAVRPTLRSVHAHWSAEGWTSDIQHYENGGLVRAHDPRDGFTYTLEDRETGDAVVLRVASPCYRDPNPGTPFTPIHPDRPG